jgi:putative PEP-CTERM system histidine kinase
MTAVEWLGYGAASLGYAVLSLLLITARSEKGMGWSPTVAALVTALWAAAQIFSSGASDAVTPHLVTLDVARYLAWFGLIAHVARQHAVASAVARAGQLASGLALCVGLAVMLGWWGVPARMSFLAPLPLPLVGGLLIGLLFADKDRIPRPSSVYLGIGLGSVMLCDALLYIEDWLPMASARELWVVRGYAAGLAVPLVTLAITRGPRSPFRFSVSRDVAFYIGSSTAIGSYVLLAIIGGQLVRQAGGTWGVVAQSLFLLAAFVLLATFVSSRSIRRSIRVHLAKHFFQHKYDYREEWLRFIATLSDSRAGEDPRVAGVRAIAQIISSPAAILLVRSDERRKFDLTATWPEDEPVPEAIDELGLSAGLIDLLQRRDWVVDLAECGRDPASQPSFQLPPSVAGTANWRLIVPVSFRDDLLGMIVLREPDGGFTLTFEDRDLLKTAARHVATHVAQHQAETRLAEARQFEAYSRLAAFMLHDLKNAAAQLQMVVANAERHRDSREFFDDAIDTVANASGRISRLIGQLGQGAAGQTGAQATIDEIAAMAINRTIDRDPRPSLMIRSPAIFVGDVRDQLGNVIENLLRNAQEATAADGTIDVVVQQSADTVIISVSDTGHGMTPAFVRERLFRPFDSTKGRRGMGIGAFQVREFARSLGGSVEVESTPGAGTTIKLFLPLSGLSAVTQVP